MSNLRMYDNEIANKPPGPSTMFRSVTFGESDGIHQVPGINKTLTSSVYTNAFIFSSVQTFGATMTSSEIKTIVRIFLLTS